MPEPIEWDKTTMTAAAPSEEEASIEEEASMLAAH